MEEYFSAINLLHVTCYMFLHLKELLEKVTYPFVVSILIK